MFITTGLISFLTSKQANTETNDTHLQISEDHIDRQGHNLFHSLYRRHDVIVYELTDKRKKEEITQLCRKL
jgi:hypothetical protein